MLKSLKQPRFVLAFAGVLVLLATLALGAASVRPTEATWQDTVHGESVFGADPAGIKNYARAISGYGSIDRQATSATTQQARAFADPKNAGGTVQLNHSDSGAFAALPLEMTGRSCARVRAQGTSDCAAADTNLAPGTSVASSEVTRIRLWLAGIRAREIVTYSSSDNQKPITATAKCEPGKIGQASVSAGGPILIREDTPLYLPPPNRQTTATHQATWLTGVTGVLQYHHSSGQGWAKAEARLYVTSNVFLSDFTFHVTLASAECGLARDTPAEPQRPTTARPAALPDAPNQPPVKTLSSPSILRILPEMTQAQAVEATKTLDSADGRPVDAHETEAGLPTLDDAANDESVRKADENAAAVTTTTPTSSPTASAPAEDTTTGTSTTPKLAASESSTAADPSDPARTEPAAPAEIAAPEPTGQAATAEGPQEPEMVRVGREFAVVNRDGIELGTAKVEDVARTPGCGVELTLTISTSAEAGPDRWDFLGPSDFAEVRTGGTTREAARISSDCGQAANSKTTALSPGRDYEIVISFHLDDSAQRAMLRPDGTAGWIFDLPPLPRVTATTSPSAAVAPTTSATSGTSAAQ